MNNISYSKRAGMCLKDKLIEIKKSQTQEKRRGYRDRFAGEIGVEPRTLSRYCREIRDIDTIAFIADKLGISVVEMISYEREIDYADKDDPDNMYKAA